ncbi:PIN domain-containing protein [Nocardioides sp. WG-D5]
MFRAVLDTCVLVPSLQRDFLLQLAAERAYAPVWSSGILDELDDVLGRLDEKYGKPEDESVAYRARLRVMIDSAFPGAAIEAPRERAYAFDIADPGDGHVVYAAIMRAADVIVTDDKKALFEMSADLEAASVDVLKPEVFAANTVAAHPGAGVRALEALAARSGTGTNPRHSAAEYLHLLVSVHDMYEVAELLEPRLAAE